MGESGRMTAVWFAISVSILVLGWEAICRLLAIPPFILPPPSAVALTLWELRDLLFGHHLWTTLREVMLGLTASILFGMTLALAMNFWRPVERIVYPYIVISQTIPIIALSPIFILWFGYSLSGKIAITVLFTFFPIVVGAYDGLRTADREMIDLLRTMGANRWQIFYKLQIPSALPSFFSGLKVAATYSVAGATIGEWLGASEGLGYFGRRASGNFQAPALFASVLLLSAIGILLFRLTASVERRVLQKSRKIKQTKQG
ncbi:ABC transporter permease [Brevibacillus humidisoli]|uniref:ABC transporter permease n=1 Tax=Brevibacillus humidisoli TaxID=2895522 RepID=UPI001E40A6CE|nr:ABC transporter permease [Brevibacillus humidisoli]UFJ42322.1 ABC transporter permease [Brevibacillus humidisoli]